MEIVEIKINKNGELKIDAKGFSDGKCLQATRPFEALGNSGSRVEKPEAHIPVSGDQESISNTNY